MRPSCCRAVARIAWRPPQHAYAANCRTLSIATETTGASQFKVSLPRSFQDMEQTDPMVAPLARSVRLCGSILGETMSTHEANGPELLEMVESLRNKTRAWRELRESNDEAAAAAKLEEIAADVNKMSSKSLRDVARAFSHFLALANGAEQEYRVRRLLQLRGGAALDANKIDSCAGTIASLLKEASAAEVLEQLSKQYVEVVLTAHPTQLYRRTLLTKHRRVTDLVGALEDHATDAYAYTREELLRDLRGVIHSLWGSDDLRRIKPTPQKEARGGLAFIETSLWDAVPAFLRRLDAVATKELGGPLPLAARPFRFASWMGGDRDGNPNVTALVTRQVVAAQRRKGAAMFLVCLDALRLDLSVREATFEVDWSDDPEVKREPYKALLELAASRLRATVRWADAELAATGGEKEILSAKDHGVAYRDDSSPSLSPDTGMIEPLFDSNELLHDYLIKAYDSLVANGYRSLADGRLKDTIRRVGAFGLMLAPLDVRQESTRHANAVAALYPHYASMTPTEKIAWLSHELNEVKRPLLHAAQFDALAASIEDKVDADVLACCHYIAAAPPGSIGAYVISQATSAADVLAVEFLMSQAGVPPSQAPRVVPLFETLDDLTNAPDSLRQLFSAPGYLERVNYRQEIMVGYSDSAKDAGRLAASWAQYNAQEKMLEVAKEFGVDLTYFHGKGGTVGRGGNPQTYAAVLAHPPKTIQGRFRVTEQGESIAFNFGEPRLAERTLDVYTAGILRDAFRQRHAVKSEWREAMDAVSKVSCETYRGVVRKEPAFVPYFRAATPELELGSLNVGSRPAKRNPKGGVESLRAIPWIFAWTQTRLNLPAWLGVDALADVDPTVLADMYQSWSWFRTNVDLIESLLARTEPLIAASYDHRLVTNPDALQLGQNLRGKLDKTITALLAVTGRPSPAADNKLLMRALKLRNPYVDVLNIIQIEALARRRMIQDTQDEDPDVTDALLVAINGIAAGLRNSG